MQSIQLTNQPDCIRWKWTANGEYTSKSAYQAQLQGIYSNIQGKVIWKAHAEGKIKFFAWLLIQQKILTADKMLLRNWPCSQTCVLCDQRDETALHLAVNCYYAKEVWHLVANWTGVSVLSSPNSVSDMKQWWSNSLAGMNARQRRWVAAIIMYTVWHIWNEHNRRIFQQSSMRPDQVFGLVQHDIMIRRMASGHPLIQEELLAV